MHPDFYFKESYRVRAYEIGQNKEMTGPALIRLMHETAMQQVIQLNISIWDLEPHHISWVLIRMQVEIKRLPLLGETITVQTNPSGFEKIFTYRDYRVYDEAGNLLAWASSTWILMDTVSRKMTRIPDFILQIDLPTNLEKLPLPTTKLPSIEDVQQQVDFRVDYYDLDFNQHLNNMFYLQWMLESIPFETLNTKSLHSINLIFKYESVYKENIVSETELQVENTFLHRLIRKRDGVEIARGKSVWC